MRPVAVRIFHQEPGSDAGPLERWVASERRALADRHAAGFVAAGATDVRIVSGPPDGIAFGRRLRELVRAEHPAGLVVLGSGAMPLATTRDRHAFVEVAGSPARRALANNRFSSDAVAIADASGGLAGLPDLMGDNALPRWLAEHAGYEVTDLARRWRLAVDIDGPLDIVLIGRTSTAPVDVELGPVRARIAAIARVAADPSGELLIAGRTSTATLGWLERMTASRTRAIVEERGLRARSADQRVPASVLGALLDRDGPGSLGRHLATLADAAVIDSRVLVAHRLGADEAAWPSPEDRFASDLLQSERISDPWLRALTESADAATIPVLLSGHSLVGPGIRLLVGRRRGATAWS